MRALIAVMMAAVTITPLAAQTVPAYRIMADQKSDDTRIVDVRIDRRLEEAELTALANQIADRDPKPAPRVTINFLLPSARLGEAPWASATLNREVKLRIAGLRLDEERLYRAEAGGDRRDVIGSWLTSTPATPGRLTIYREGGRLLMEWRMRTGVTTRDELRETKVAGGRRFDLRSSSAEDHFVMTPGGDLELRAKASLIAVAERIRDNGPVPVAAEPRNPGTERWPAVALPVTAPAPQGAAGIAVVDNGRVRPTHASVEEKPQPAAVAATETAARPQPKAKPRPEPAAKKPGVDMSIFLNPAH